MRRRRRPPRCSVKWSRHKAHVVGDHFRLSACTCAHEKKRLAFLTRHESLLVSLNMERSMETRGCGTFFLLNGFDRTLQVCYRWSRDSCRSVKSKRSQYLSEFKPTDTFCLPYASTCISNLILSMFIFSRHFC